MKRIILTSDENVQVIRQPANTSFHLRDHKDLIVSLLQQAFEGFSINIIIVQEAGVQFREAVLDLSMEILEECEKSRNPGYKLIHCSSLDFSTRVPRFTDLLASKSPAPQFKDRYDPRIVKLVGLGRELVTGNVFSVTVESCELNHGNLTCGRIWLIHCSKKEDIDQFLEQGAKNIVFLGNTIDTDFNHSPTHHLPESVECLLHQYQMELKRLQIDLFLAQRGKVVPAPVPIKPIASSVSLTGYSVANVPSSSIKEYHPNDAMSESSALSMPLQHHDSFSAHTESQTAPEITRASLRASEIIDTAKINNRTGDNNSSIFPLPPSLRSDFEKSDNSAVSVGGRKPLWTRALNASKIAEQLEGLDLTSWLSEQKNVHILEAPLAVNSFDAKRLHHFHVHPGNPGDLDLERQEIVRLKRVFWLPIILKLAICIILVVALIVGLVLGLSK